MSFEETNANAVCHHMASQYVVHVENVLHRRPKQRGFRRFILPAFFSLLKPNGRFAPEAVVPAKFVYDPKPRCLAMPRIGVLISFRKSDHEAESLTKFREEDCRDTRLVNLPER
jgi:hypothetical protein